MILMYGAFQLYGIDYNNMLHSGLNTNLRSPIYMGVYIIITKLRTGTECEKLLYVTEIKYPECAVWWRYSGDIWKEVLAFILASVQYPNRVIIQYNTYQVASRLSVLQYSHFIFYVMVPGMHCKVATIIILLFKDNYTPPGRSVTWLLQTVQLFTVVHWMKMNS